MSRLPGASPSTQQSPETKHLRGDDSGEVVQGGDSGEVGSRFYFRRFSFAVNDSPPAPQHGQLMATRMPCFCSSSRSVRSSIARACCANRSCRENPLALVASPDDGGGELPNASGGGGGANVPLLERMLLGRLAMAGAYYLRTIFTISSMSPRRKQAMLCSTVGSARSA